MAFFFLCLLFLISPSSEDPEVRQAVIEALRGDVVKDADSVLPAKDKTTWFNTFFGNSKTVPVEKVKEIMLNNNKLLTQSFNIIVDLSAEIANMDKMLDYTYPTLTPLTPMSKKRRVSNDLTLLDDEGSVRSISPSSYSSSVKLDDGRTIDLTKIPSCECKSGNCVKGRCPCVREGLPCGERCHGCRGNCRNCSRNCSK
jgi:hypothetical protein